jgi:tetratricopeptide (TPR) repeat protein
MNLTIDQILNQAISAHQEERLEEAEENYKKVIELKPHNSIAHVNLGTLLQRLGKFDEAETSFKKGIDLKPDFFEAHYNLGNVLKILGKLEEAVACYKKAITLKPDFALASNNLGNIFMELGKYEDAEISFKKAIELKSDFAGAYDNLGNIKIKLGKYEEAEIYFKKAMELEPKYAMKRNIVSGAPEVSPSYEKVLIIRGLTLFDKGEFELSLKDFDECNSKLSRMYSLTSLFALGRIEAFASFIAAKEGRETAHNFCKNPLDFIHHSNISSHIKSYNIFINELIDKVKNMNSIWEPSGRTIRKGFKCTNDLFKNPLTKLNDLKSIIINEIDSYYLKFKDEDCSFIKKWPSEKNLRAWHVILKQQGHLISHIHPGAWLSGVIYLKVAPSNEKNEGAIEFSLNSKNYFDPSLPKLIHQPKVGDIVLFPSSLHHRTIPYTADEDRISISFDLMPDVN